MARGRDGGLAAKVPQIWVVGVAMRAGNLRRRDLPMLEEAGILTVEDDVVGVAMRAGNRTLRPKTGKATGRLSG